MGTYHCHLEAARVRSDQSKRLQEIIQTLFARRHVGELREDDQRAQRAELVRKLRRRSRLYRQLCDAAGQGPIPFALGFFQVEDDRLEITANPLLLSEPQRLARLLSEFLEPGARVHFERSGKKEGWEIKGVGEIERIT